MTARASQSPGIDSSSVSRLIHLNGPPGIGKSTLARRYVADHAGVLNCDIDMLRTLVGGWASDFPGAGALIRPAALAMIEAYLASGHDVVLPQMLADPAELVKRSRRRGRWDSAQQQPVPRRLEPTHATSGLDKRPIHTLKRNSTTSPSAMT
jgi:hypothetical protein